MIMKIGIPREIKSHEYRVSVTPSGVMELKADGHRVLVEESAGQGSGFSDQQYKDAGADILDRQNVFGESDLIVKVKEPLKSEYELLRDNSSLFTFLHLAPNRELIDVLLNKRIASLGYETLEENCTLPLLAPMSEIAGRMSPIVAAYYLQRAQGGSGILPPGAAGVMPAKALVLGAGLVGYNAARIAHALGMRVAVLNRGVERLRRLDEAFYGQINTLVLSKHNVMEQLPDADIVIGAVLVTGMKAPVLIKRGMLSMMKRGSVVVDVSVDQGGCIETTRPTTHDDPVYDVDGIIHYAVTNMPGAYPRTSTLALTNVTLPHIRRLAGFGIEQVISRDASLRTALNTYQGGIVHSGLAESTGLPVRELHG
jgi:alanine dehydrogenase